MRKCEFCGITGAESAARGESFCNRDGLVGPHSFVDFEPTWYEKLAAVYAERYGEPLVAVESWCEPLYDATETAVSCDESYAPEVPEDLYVEARKRTADVIAVMTYGLTEAAKMIGVVTA